MRFVVPIDVRRSSFWVRRSVRRSTFVVQVSWFGD